ncbi:hypothetical protein RJ55_08251 [Drechmeria coniospora]|nr:hypothetical protein RJ55_08251 [Drechmeria coniospora]
MPGHPTRRALNQAPFRRGTADKTINHDEDDDNYDDGSDDGDIDERTTMTVHFDFDFDLHPASNHGWFPPGSGPSYLSPRTAAPSLDADRSRSTDRSQGPVLGSGPLPRRSSAKRLPTHWKCWLASAAESLDR